jgi:hypothetical protein
MAFPNALVERALLMDICMYMSLDVNFVFFSFSFFWFHALLGVGQVQGGRREGTVSEEKAG